MLDYETFSEADLKKVGAWEYSVHRTTEIMCASWRIGTKEELRAALKAKRRPCIWAASSVTSHLRDWIDLSPIRPLADELSDPSVVMVAHNAFFEQVITRNVLRVPFAKPRRWICTASQARALSLPGNLEGACLALKLNAQKNMEGRRLILKYCKPRKPSKNDPSTRWSDSEELAKILNYCQDDVDAETELFLETPELIPVERETWLLDQEMNMHGLCIDRINVRTILELIAAEEKNFEKEIDTLTGGEFKSTRRTAAVKEWLDARGCMLPNLQAKTVSDALQAGLAEGPAKRLLELRQESNKTSTKKYQALEMRSRSDGKLRDLLIYHGASTGRWTGAGFQPQNLPRGTVKDPESFLPAIGIKDIEYVRLLHHSPMNVFSTLIRSMIESPSGSKFYDGDFNAIELRVLFWMSGDEYGLKALKAGRDLYAEIAAEIYKILLKHVTPDQRDLGKRAELGCGYGMGPDKFFDTCQLWGQGVEYELARRAVAIYRAKHPSVPKMWSNTEKAAIAAVRKPGKVFTTAKVSWFVNDKDKRFLWCKLPSGRKIAYPFPSVKFEPNKWKEKRAVLYHFGVDQKIHQWTESGTYGGRLVENVVQATARDVMRDAMLRVRNAGYRVALSVHDELLSEHKNGDLSEYLKLMSICPAWADGLPIKVGGWSGERYKK